MEQPQHPPRQDAPASTSTLPDALRTGLTGVALWLLALIPRLHAALLGFVTPDEPSWVFRGLRFSQALQAKEWAGTFQIGHPGVITMWVSALGIWWQRWRAVPGTAERLAWIDRVAWVTPNNGALLDRLAAFLPPSRVAMAALCSLGIVGAYLLSRKLWGRRVALAGAVLMALNPFLAALSGLLHVDAPATTLLLLSLLAWLVALQSETGFSDEQETRFLRPTAGWPRLLGPLFYALLSGLCAGLAILAKSPSIYALAASGLSALFFLLLAPGRSWSRLGRIALLGLIWTLGLIAALYSFPAMWSDPLGVLGGIYGLAGRHLDVPHGVSFYRGTAGGVFGPGFYPTVLLYRLTPAVLIGLALAVWATVRALGSGDHKRAPAATLLSLWAFSAGYTAFMTFAAKKFDRYLLPVFPVLDLLAALGWVEGLRWLAARRGARRLPAQAVAALLVGLAVAQLAVALPAWPYLLDAYNPLAGGLSSAMRTLAVGWGEGSERLAADLNGTSDGREWIVAAGSPVTLAPLTESRVLPLDETSRLLADKILITALDRQIAPQRVAGYISGAELERTLRVAGQEFLWLYARQNRAETEHLARYGAPGDLVLCDTASSFCRYAQSADAQGEPWHGNVHLVVDAGEAEIVAMLNRWSARHTRLWYLAYPGATGATAATYTLPSDLASPITAGILRRQLESSATRLDHVDLGDLTATLYILPQESSFQVGAGAFAPIRFDGQLAVTGARLYDAQPAADGEIRFYLRWSTETAPQDDLRVFVHLLDDEGQMRKAGRGQELLVDRRGWPTSYWEPGDPAVGLDYALGLPPGLPPGDYQLVLGLADAETGEWLPVVDAENRIVGSTADLLPVRIGPASKPPSPDALHLARPSDAAWPAADGTPAALRLLGHSAPSHAQTGQSLVIEAGWHAIAAAAGRPGQDLQLLLGLAGADGEFVLRETHPLSRHRTSDWRAGEVIHELYELRLPPELEGGAYTLTLTLLDQDAHPIPLAAGDETVRLGTLRVSVQERLFALSQAPRQPLDLALSTAASPQAPIVTLLGYDLAPTEPSDRVSLTLYWRCEQTMETSYSVFAHLLDDAGRVQGQRDRIPSHNGAPAPTNGWIAGQIVVDAYEIALNPDAPAGTYRIEVGMYDARDMTRLQMVDAQGQPLPGDRYLLLEETRLEPAK